MTTTFLFFGSAAARASGDPRKVLPIARPAASRKKSRRVREINPEPSCNGVMADCLQRDSQERRLFLKSQTAVSRRAACPNRPSAALEASGKPPTAVAPRPASYMDEGLPEAIMSISQVRIERERLLVQGNCIRILL